MATFASVVQEVYNLTNRSDLVNETATAVKAATLKVHQSDFYPKDLYETGVSFTTAAYVQSLEYRSIAPNYRALKYIRKTDADATDTGKFLEIVTPEKVVDDYKLNRTDIAYLAGSVIQIKSSTELQYIYFGCYVHPDVTSTGYNSWIADEHLYAIVFEAAGMVFKMIGFDEQAAMNKQLAGELLQEVRSSQLLAVGY